MAGDGGDALPHTTLDDGKFLLQLLQRRPQHLHPLQVPQQQQPPHRHGLFDAPSVPSPPQSLAHDPAVAAVGPSLTFPMQPSNGHDFAHRPWSHALPSPYPPHLVGFPQNPPWTSLPPGFLGTDGLGLHSHLDRRLTDEEKLGFFGGKIRNNSADPQGAQKLMFGSFPCEIGSQGGLSNGGSVLGFDSDGLSSSTLNASEEREMGVCNRGFDGSIRDRYLQSPPVQNLNAFGRSGSGYRQQQMPPGFSKKLNSDSGGRFRGVENCMDEVNHCGFSSNGKHETLRKTSEQGKMQAPSAEARLYEQLGQPAPPSGTNIHSDVDESLMDGRSEDKRRMGGGSDQARRELDDLSERVVDSLGLDDGLDEIHDLKQYPNSRDKEVRSDPRGQRLLSQRERNFKRHMECRHDIRELNAPFLSIYESLIPLEEERAKQKKFMTLLEKLVYKEWPNAQLYLYGSYANSFELSKSDVDVCLVFKDAGMDKSEVLMRLADILRSANLQNVQALTRARVPIVKLMDPETGISCDICINNILAVVNTKLLRDYAQIDVRLRQLAFIVKHWAKSRGVNETYQGTLSSYAYVLMCIHFLQQRKPAILPCLQGMKTTYFEIVDDVQCAFFDQVDSLRNFGSVNEESIAQLVWAFFNYWAYCHNYTNDVISVRTGRMISKRTKDWTRRVGNDRHLICIEDPFEVSHDLGRVVDRKSIKVLREEFERAAHIMQVDPNPCVTLFEPYMPR